MDFIYQPPDPDEIELDRIKKEKESVVVQYNQISDEEAKLLEELGKIQRAKEAERLRLKELEREEKKYGPAEITAYYDVGSMQQSIAIQVDPNRPDVSQLIKKYNPMANIEYTGRQNISVDIWPEFYNEVSKLKKIKWLKIEHLSEPFWKIKKHQKQLVVQWNPRLNHEGYLRGLKQLDNPSNSLILIPGSTKDLRLKGYTIPLNEGWRLFEIHPDLKSRLCEWESEELLRDVEREFRKRMRMREIHTAEDSLFNVVFPGNEHFILRGHQKVALEFSYLTDGKSLIAYSMGTGKTAIFVGDAIRRNSPRNVIVCPGALRANWKHHIFELTGEYPITLAGRIPTQDDIYAVLGKKPKWIIINYDILRTESKFDRVEGNPAMGKDTRYLWVELLNMFQPTFIGLDECHYVGNPDSNQSKAVRLLRGTPETTLMAGSGTPIKNKPGELWAILNWLHPDLFPYHDTFLKDYGFGRSILPSDAKKLRSLLESIMLKRSRQDINKNLPPINRIVENYQMSDRAQQIYNRILKGLWEQMKEYDYQNKGGTFKSVSNILEKLNRLIQVCAADKIQNTVDKSLDLIESLQEEEHNKVLIFTRFKGTCCTIAEKLRKEGHNTLQFVNRTRKGFKTLEMEERMELVKQFQTDPSIKFLVVTSGTAREGLDITKAGVVVFNDLFWNPAAHQQCEGRAFFRESDLHGGDSYYLQFEDSIEDWLTDINGIKQNTIEQIIEGKGGDMNAINQIMERIRELFKKRGLAA